MFYNTEIRKDLSKKYNLTLIYAFLAKKTSAVNVILCDSHLNVATEAFFKVTLCGERSYLWAYIFIDF
jgi:hypothetical protein